MSSEIDWFDLDLVIDFDGVSLTLAELKKALQKEKKFVRLRDGSIARLPEKLIQKFEKGEDIILADFYPKKSQGSLIKNGYVIPIFEEKVKGKKDRGIIQLGDFYIELSENKT